MSLSVLNWLLGGSTLALLVLAVVAPNVLAIFSSLLKEVFPIIGDVYRGLKALAVRLWDGVLDVSDNINTVLLLIACAGSAYLYGSLGVQEARHSSSETKAVASSHQSCKCPSKVTKDEPIFKIPGWEIFR